MILHRLAACFVLATLAALPAMANGLDLPAHARQLANRVSPLGSYALPVGPYEAGSLPARIFEGRIERQSWRLEGTSETTLQVLAPLRDQVLAAGYEIVLDCAGTICGGFDFRFKTEVIPAPDMHVGLRDYRFVAAVRDDEALSLLVSRAGNATYVQIIHTLAQEQNPRRISPRSRPDPQGNPTHFDGLIAALQGDGHVVLADLVFETGAARLGVGPFTSLEQLAGFLMANPDQRIALVGHTDNVGSLEGNISLSKRRAGSVRARMTDHYGIAPARIEDEGMGYLAPVASNLTDRGREANRRVEAILLSE